MDRCLVIVFGRLVLEEIKAKFHHNLSIILKFGACLREREEGMS